MVLVQATFIAPSLWSSVLKPTPSSARSAPPVLLTISHLPTDTNPFRHPPPLCHPSTLTFISIYHHPSSSRCVTHDLRPTSPASTNRIVKIKRQSSLTFGTTFIQKTSKQSKVRACLVISLCKARTGPPLVHCFLIVTTCCRSSLYLTQPGNPAPKTFPSTSSPGQETRPSVPRLEAFLLSSTRKPN